MRPSVTPATPATSQPPAGARRTSKLWALLLPILLGFATTLAICLGAVCWNALSSLPEHEKSVSADWNTISSVPQASSLYEQSTGEYRYRGMAIFICSAITKSAASELAQNQFGPTRSDCFAAQHVFYHAHVSEPKPAPQFLFCGGVVTGPIQHWRWIGAGWPFIAFQCDAASAEYPFGSFGTTTPHWLRVSGGIDITPILPSRAPPAFSKLSSTTILPLTPMWSGLALNTALYALLWLGLLSASLFLFRHAHARKHLCISCGYDQSGTPTNRCPECGTPQPLPAATLIHNSCHQSLPRASGASSTAGKSCRENPQGCLCIRAPSPDLLNVPFRLQLKTDS